MAGDPFSVFVAHLSIITNEKEFDAKREEVIRYILKNFFLKARTEGELVWRRNENGLRGDNQVVAEFHVLDNAGIIRTVEVTLTENTEYVGLFMRTRKYYEVTMFRGEDFWGHSIIRLRGKFKPDNYKLPHEYTQSIAIYALGERLFEG